MASVEPGNDSGGTDSLKSRWADWLDIHGGFVLLAGAAVLIALAAVLADHVAVAPVFAGFGCVLIVIAVFYSRIEGRLEANRNGVSIAVREAQRLSREQKLTPEQTNEVVELAVESANVPVRGPEEARQVGEQAAMRAVAKLATRLQQEDLISAFEYWLIATEGFASGRIEREVPSEDGRIDLVARKDDLTVMAEATTHARLLGPGSVFRLQHLQVSGLPENAEVRRAFIIPLGQKDDLTIAGLAEVASIEVYGVSSDERVERLVPD